MLGIENFIGLGVVDDFVVQGDDICNGLAAVPVIKPPQLLEAGIGDLGDVLADLDAGDHLPVFLHRGQLVHPAKHRIARGGDQTLAHPKGIHTGPLLNHVLNDVFVQRVGSGYLAVREPGVVQHFAGFFA